jgi:tRNA A-37 threonylcarbamoyl transferase component Bud32
VSSAAPLAAPKVCPSCGTRYPTDALFCPNDGTPLTTGHSSSEPSGESDPYLGREISGHIEIRQLAGIGAMGRVYRAFQRGIDRDVAVKILHRELSANQQLVARFHREAKVASRLSHANVVQVHLAGQLPDGALYIVMEYLDGLSLQSALAAAGGAMPLPRALHVALQICEAAGEAHAQGIVHRDLKPENVMLVRRAEDADYVKVLDFGIARLNWGEQSMATAAGLIFGTARYISPEGAQGEAVGPSGDVYAIATLLFQMLAGRTPFEGDQAVALLVQQIHDAPPPLKSIPRAAYLPDRIATLVMKNLAKNPADRAPDGRVLGRQLVDAVKASGLSLDDLGPRSALLGAKAGAMQLPPMNRTKQLPEMAAEVESRIASDALREPRKAEPRAKGLDVATRAIGSKAPAPAATEAARALASAPPGIATTKWVPPAELQSQLAEVRPQGSSVDPTLDDETPPPAQEKRDALASAPRVRTEIAEPSPVAQLPYFPVRPEESAAPPRAAVPTTKPSAAGAALGEPPAPHAEDETHPRRERSRTIVVVFLCFLVGVILATATLYRKGLIGPAASAGSLDDYVARSADAMRQKRWDAPAGDNVRDLTNAALAKWPKDPRILDIRARSTDELVKEAVGQKFAGDLPQALHLAQLANELDPTDTTAQHLVDEYQQEGKPTEDVAPSVSEAGAPAPRASTGKASVTPSGPRALLEVSVAKPRIGQPVTFSAKVVGASGAPPKTPPEEPQFRLNGPGLAADTKLAAMGDSPGFFRTAFTFFEPGRYEVSFNARVDGAQLKVTRSIVVGDGAPPPSTAPGNNAPLPPPSGKWL